jgi:hypothetical protein
LAGKEAEELDAFFLMPEEDAPAEAAGGKVQRSKSENEYEKRNIDVSEVPKDFFPLDAPEEKIEKNKGQKYDYPQANPMFFFHGNNLAVNLIIMKIACQRKDGSVAKSGVIVLGQDNDFPVGGQASPCMFLTKPTRAPRSSNTQGLAWPHLLSDVCALFCFTPLFATESERTKW